MTHYSLTAIHELTDDLPSGEPWMPDGRDFWSIVDQANGRTKWRRIVLTKKSKPSFVAGAGGRK
jgi:hypothetical protein